MKIIVGIFFGCLTSFACSDPQFTSARAPPLLPPALHNPLLRPLPHPLANPFSHPAPLPLSHPLASPRPPSHLLKKVRGSPYRHFRILKDDRLEHAGDGHFEYGFATENGIEAHAVGRPGSRGQSNVEGFYSYPLPDGTLAKVHYVADEFGFRPTSSLIPTPPPHALQQIRVAQEQRARGIIFQ